MNESYTKEDILRQLAEMNAPLGGIVLMHSSLRSVGTVEGGAKTLLDAMIEYFTGNGGLFCVPAHTWHNLDKEITLNVKDPDNCLGAFSTVAIEDGRGVRSKNPTHSMVVFGDRARALEFIKDDLNVETPTDPRSCYGKIINEGGHILLVGVAHNKNTILHTVDEMLSLPNRMDNEFVPVSVLTETGEKCDRKIRLFFTDYTDDISYRFPKYETAFRYHGCIVDGFVGNAPTQLCDAALMKKTVELIYRNSKGEDPLKDEEAIPQKWYCCPL